MNMPARWRARFLILVMVLLVAYGSTRIYDVRSHDAAQVKLSSVTLTAQSIPVESLRTGRIASVKVTAGMKVKAGQPLGTLNVTKTTAAGQEKTSVVKLTAPAAGVAVDEPLSVGQTLQPGQAFVTLYDPARLTLVTDVSTSKVPLLTPGMTATLNATGGTKEITAKVDRFVPRIAGTSTAEGRLQAVLVPTDPAGLALLTPGMTFTGSVDTGSSTSAGAPSNDK